MKRLTLTQLRMLVDLAEFSPRVFGTGRPHFYDADDRTALTRSGLADSGARSPDVLSITPAGRAHVRKACEVTRG